MDLDELYRLLRGAHVQAQAVVNTIRDPLLVLAPDLTVISANPAFYRTFETGREATVGIPLYELGGGQWNIDELRLLLETVIPKSTSVIDYEVRASFPEIGVRTMLVSAQRLLHPDNGQRVLLLTIVDATERRQKEDEKNILIGELDHRIKNLLSVTQALARQTRADGRTAADYRDDFLGRLSALGRSFDASSGRLSTSLPELARTVMRPYFGASTAVRVADEPPVSLAPDQAMSLGMILHELATNALKHGSLSAPGGEVRLSWSLATEADGHPWVALCWVEQGGPETAPPQSTGFGARLIKFAAERELGGRAELHYRSGGLAAEVFFPTR